MPSATWNNTIIAEAPAGDIVTVEGNMYFPLAFIKPGILKASEHTTVCGWKGTANYYDVVVDGKTNSDAAWYYATPKDAAKEIAGRVAFWKGIVCKV